MVHPVSTSERHIILDVLRGFALLGVILANMASHSGYFFLSGDQRASLDVFGIDGVITWLLNFLVDGKFYSLFSMLFGIGFAIQMQRAEESGIPFGSRFRRRLLVMFLIGLAHAILFYVGDILTVYAIMGGFLLLFRKLTDKALLRWVVILLFLPIIQYAILWLPAPGQPDAFDAGRNPLFDQLIVGYQTGSLKDILLNNIGGLIFGRYPDLFFTGRFFRVMAMFIVGFYVARNILFIPTSQNRHRIKRIMIASAFIGIPCNLVLAMMMETNAYYGLGTYGIIEPLVYAYGVPALCIFYAAAIVLLYEKSFWRRTLQVFAPVGQMALTNYLLQSVICCLIFMSYGLGWFGRVGPALLMLTGLAIYGSQVMFSKWWLARYRFGPMEWVWRSLTYRSWQRMRRVPAVGSPA